MDLDKSIFGDFARKDVLDVLTRLEFYSMISRIPVSDDGDDGDGDEQQSAFDLGVDKPPVDYTIVDTEDALESLVSAIATPEGFSFDTETTSQNPMTARLVGLSFSVEPHAGWYVPVGHSEGAQLPMDAVLGALGPIFTDEGVPKTAHNANYDMMVLENHGITVEGLAFDTMLAAHAAGHSSVGLKNLALNFFGEEMTPISDLIGTGRKQITMDRVDISSAAEYAAADADFTERLRRDLEIELREKALDDMLREYEMPLVPVLVRMQRDGVAINVGALHKMSEELGTELDRIRNDMYLNVGHEFNLNSSKQLGDVLFTELRLPPTPPDQVGPLH